MVQVRAEHTIERPVEDVFRVAVDPEQQLRWDAKTLKSVQKLSPGPLERGARYRGTFKQFGTVEYEYAEFDPPNRFSHVSDMRMGRSEHVFTLEQTPGGTRLTQEGRIEPSGGWKLLSPMMGVMLRRRFNAIAEELRTYLATSTA